MKAKRFGSLLLTIVMVASLITALPVSASAAEVQNGTAYSANNITYSGQTRQASTGSFFVDNIGDVDYNGNYQTPKPIVMSLSGTVLRENRDYELSYHNNRNAGIATITITGLGSYETRSKPCRSPSMKPRCMSVSTVSNAQSTRTRTSVTRSPAASSMGTTRSPSLSIRSTTGATGQRASPPVSPGWTTMTYMSQTAS